MQIIIFSYNIMNELLQKPSLYAHVLNAVFLLIAFILIIMNYSQVVKLGAYEKITLSLLISGVVGVHGLSHLGLEGVYGYNPMRMLLSSSS
jgi:hypothetical protein